MGEASMREERRVGYGLAFLLGWYVVFAAVGYVVVRIWQPESGTILLITPIVLVAAAIVAPTTLAILAQNRRRRLGAVALAGMSAAAGIVFVVVASLIGFAVR
jgi:tryptophan-rich sensory protein